MLDRNCLRPGRCYITTDDRVILASEVSVLYVPDQCVLKKGRLTPGGKFLIDFENERIVGDPEIKHKLSTMAPFGSWLKKNKISIVDRPVSLEKMTNFEESCMPHQETRHYHS